MPQTFCRTIRPKMSTFVPRLGSLIVVSLLFGDVASGALVAGQVAIRLDSNLGPDWEGYVDTNEDIFVLTSWTEDRSAFWTPAPSSLPIIMPAIDNTGASYDVPSDFGLLGIGSTWGFVGPDVGDITWAEGVTAWGGRGYRVAWGASMSPGTSPVEIDYTGDEYIGGVALGSSFIGLRTNFSSVSIPEPNVGLFLLGGLAILGWRKGPMNRPNR